MLKKIKNNLYFRFVEKNPEIRDTYQTYVNANKEFHKKNRLKSWRYMMRLNKAFKKKQKLTTAALPEGAVNPWIKAKKPAAKKPAAPAKTAAAPAKKPTTPAKKPAATTAKNLPYLDGAESQLYKRGSPLSFVLPRMKFDVISFDVFDTLILRPFNKPITVFHILAQKLKILNFSSLRREAETTARNKKEALYGTREVNIYDIYEVINEQSGLDIELGVQTEFETELELCYPNPYMMHVFKALKARGKKIIAVSDMYLPHNMIKTMLNKCGFEPDELYVSCEYGVSKRSTFLYKTIAKKYPRGTTFCHIGDNHESDFKSAGVAGWSTAWYQQNHNRGNKYRADNMSELVGSAYAGIVNNELHNGLNKFTPHFEYGFLYGGLYVLGFANYIHRFCKEKNIDKILFLARDGKIYQQAYQRIYKEDCIPSNYLLWSRIANCKYLSATERFDFLNRAVRIKAAHASSSTHTLSSTLKALSLESLIPLLKTARLQEHTIICPQTEKQIIKFFNDNWDKVLKAYEGDEQYLHAMLSGAIGDSKRVLVVDVGWTGACPLGIKHLVEEKWKLAECFCMMAGSKIHNHGAVNIQQMQEEVSAYLFSQIHNTANYNTHNGTNMRLNSMFFELFTQDTFPSFAGIGNTGNLLFDIPEVENYKTIDEIHNGILRFVDLYVKHFKKYPYMLNVSGHDAYQPFRTIIKDLKFIKKNFSDFSYTRSAGSDLDDHKAETIKDWLDAFSL